MKFFQRLENLFAATAFAEEGDFETARQMVDETVPEEAPETRTNAEGANEKRAPRGIRARVSRSKAA